MFYSCLTDNVHPEGRKTAIVLHALTLKGNLEIQEAFAFSLIPLMQIPFVSQNLKLANAVTWIITKNCLN